MGDLERLQAIGWFAGLEPQVRTALLGRGRVRRRRAGEWLYGEGDEDTGVVAVLEGGLHLYAQAPGGREALFGFLPPGALMGQSIVFGGGPRMLTAICAAQSRLFLLSDQALSRTAEEHPSLWRSLLALAYGQQRNLVEAMAAQVALSPRQRLISRLLAASGGEARVPVSQAALAEMIGASRKAVNAWLAELERAGKLARGYGWVEIADRPGLARLLAV